MLVKEEMFVSLMDDIMFKYLFGYEKNVVFTEYLLELLFGYKEGHLHNKIKIKNSLKLDKDKLNEHGFELDIAVEMPDDNIINLECYTSGQLKKGENLSNAHNHLQINLVKDNVTLSQEYLILSKDDKNIAFLKDLFEIRVINMLIIS